MATGMEVVAKTCAVPACGSKCSLKLSDDMQRYGRVRDKYSLDAEIGG